MTQARHVRSYSRDRTHVTYPDSTADLLTEVLSQLTEGVATLSGDGVVVSWNPSAANLTGYTLAEINTAGFIQAFEPADVMARLVCQANQGIPASEVHLTLKCAGGERRLVDIRCWPLRHQGKTQGRLVVVMRDLSELRALQNRLLQNERSSILGRLAGAVSHDMRNPLTAIFLQADLLEDELIQPDGGNRQQLLHCLAVIKQEAMRLRDLIQQYLSLARLSDLPRDPVNLWTYLDAFVEEVQASLASQQIVLRLEGSPNLGPVALHTNSFRRVLLNLIGNAAEAMPEGGTVRLRLERGSEACLRLDVSDTGHGIAPERVPFVFSPFHSTKPEGTGLGLYLVREIVTAHKGTITVTSQVGEGTTFTLTLPLMTSEEAAAPAKGRKE